MSPQDLSEVYGPYRHCALATLTGLEDSLWLWLNNIPQELNADFY